MLKFKKKFDAEDGFLLENDVLKSGVKIDLLKISGRPAAKIKGGGQVEEVFIEISHTSRHAWSNTFRTSVKTSFRQQPGIFEPETWVAASPYMPFLILHSATVDKDGDMNLIVPDGMEGTFRLEARTSFEAMLDTGIGAVQFRPGNVDLSVVDADGNEPTPDEPGVANALASALANGAFMGKIIGFTLNVEAEKAKAVQSAKIAALENQVTELTERVTKLDDEVRTLMARSYSKYG